MPFLTILFHNFTNLYKIIADLAHAVSRTYPYVQWTLLIRNSFAVCRTVAHVFNIYSAMLKTRCSIYSLIAPPSICTNVCAEQSEYDII